MQRTQTMVRSGEDHRSLA